MLTLLASLQVLLALMVQTVLMVLMALLARLVRALACGCPVLCRDTAACEASSTCPCACKGACWPFRGMYAPVLARPCTFARPTCLGYLQARLVPTAPTVLTVLTATTVPMVPPVTPAPLVRARA